MGTIAGAPKFSADSSRGFNDPNGKYPLYVDESDVNKLARALLLLRLIVMVLLERLKRLIKPSTPTIM